MVYRFLFTVLLIHTISTSFSQPKDFPNVVISHIFLCVDSATYQNLFQHDFIRTAFAYTREMTNQTSTDSYTGKYLMGRQSYIEVFAPVLNKPALGDKFGDLGLVFRTRKPGDIQKIEQHMKQENKQPIFKVLEYEDSGKLVSFNQNLYLSKNPLEETFRPYVEEFTIEFLKICGFNESETHSGITEEQFREKRSGRKYARSYDNIEKIELELTKEEFEYLAEMLRYLNFTRQGYQFTNGFLEIACSLNENRSYKLKAIHFKLLNPTNDILIKVSSQLIFKAGGTKASFALNYNIE